MKMGASVACATLLCLAAASAAAGSFSVAPTRVEFDAGRRTAVVTINNPDASPLTVQVAAVDWQQPGGADSYAPTADILATPPVFTVAPNSEQIVRIALRRAPGGGNELPYRIFFQEVPPAPKPGSNTLNVALRVGIPVFVQGRCDEALPALRWTAARAANGDIALSAENTGCMHVQVTGLSVQFGDGAFVPLSAIKYVLPGNRMTWTLTPPAGADASQLHIQGDTDRGEIHGAASLTPAS
ncbi:MAG TPA: molecular chaperone [Steroidobacteraceae bacterium]|nr:molecular chaperone [Steroidobacteraceae bacterium]